MSGTHTLLVIYDLRNPSAWQAAHRHRGFWGRLYTDVVELDDDRVVLIFTPTPDERWRAWERVRRAWIERELQGGAAA